ncbi:MAG: type I DNA topoisomerase [Chloroflexi bacterium]|nr:type I DNA topoisomerase [Chloroflexota bacterium]
MTKKLVIVESPAKAKTIAHYLGSDYRVKASIGHVRDLPKKGLGLDIEAGYVPEYVISADKTKVIDELRRDCASSSQVYLATDPDREGEAIAWHVVQATGCDPAKTARVSFHQVTADAVREAIANPRELDRDLIDAQQARRVLDRLVGYQISPLLNRAAKGYGQHTLSAGRVQSVALRLVVEREREIMRFVATEYWTVTADLQRREGAYEQFTARLVAIRGSEPELHTQEATDAVLDDLRAATYRVLSQENGTRRANPPPPFITSTLQAEAAHKLHSAPRQTMRTAQQLYEGIQLGAEHTGLITYMRTDSTQVAKEAQQQARALIAQRWGTKYMPAKPPSFRTKVANAQEAHEAIRPTDPRRTPEAVAPYLSKPQLALYELIWRRFMASQMSATLYATSSIDIAAGDDYLLRASGATLTFPGYKAVYSEAREDEEEEADVALPQVRAGELLDLRDLHSAQHFTEPPPRYSESLLIRVLERHGVGRPSTYASIIGVIQDRGYVVKERGRLKPSDIGFVVCDTLVAAFSEIMDIRYTAEMEIELDQVADGSLTYRSMLDGFYGPFSASLEQARAEVSEALERALWVDLPSELQQERCPICGKQLQIRLSDAGRFLSCSGYPKCRYTRNLPTIAGEQAEPTYAEGESCELCGGRMKVLTKGRSKFLGCENYPTCKNTRAILSAHIKQVAASAQCPVCQGALDPRKGRFGEYLHCAACKTNYSLAKLGLKKARTPRKSTPAPLVEVACPQCQRATMESRAGKYGPYYRCPDCKVNYSQKKLGITPLAD